MPVRATSPAQINARVRMIEPPCSNEVDPKSRGSQVSRCPTACVRVVSDCRGLSWHPVRPGVSTGRRGLARLEDVLNLNFDVRLAMALQPAVVLPPAEVLNRVLDRRMGGNLTNHLGPLHDRPSDKDVRPSGDQKDVPELDGRSDGGLTVVQSDGVADTDPVLA